MHFIQRKQKVSISTYFKFEDFSWMLPRATENAVAGHMRPAGL